MSVKMFLCSVGAKLSEMLSGFARTVTVEAEYGDEVVEGSLLTLAHHGARSGNPAPCLADNGVAGKPDEVEVIGLSHLDLDSLGGVMAVMGVKPECPGFWELAAFVDTNGPHKLDQSGATDENIARLNAVWAWNNTHKVFAPRDGSVLVVTDHLVACFSMIKEVCEDNPELIEAGEAFRKEGEKLNADSFVEFSGDVIFRIAPSFVNHLYVSPDGQVAKAVVGFNTLNGGITVSLADPIEGVSARDIVQDLWGPEAGGHTGIAGSPRGTRRYLGDLLNAFEAVKRAVRSRKVVIDTDITLDACMAAFLYGVSLKDKVVIGPSTDGDYDIVIKLRERYDSISEDVNGDIRSGIQYTDGYDNYEEVLLWFRGNDRTQDGTPIEREMVDEIESFITLNKEGEFPALNDLFEGMLAIVSDPYDRLWKGIDLIDSLLSRDEVNPGGPIAGFPEYEAAAKAAK